MITVRYATIKDAPDIADLSNQLGYPMSHEDTLDHLGTLLGSENHAVFVADLSDGTTIGWIHVFKAQRIESGSFAEIGGFIVSKEFRSKGIGRNLLHAAEEWTKQKKLSKLRVRSKVERDDAKKFYSNMAFSLSKQQNVFDKLMVQENAEL